MLKVEIIDHHMDINPQGLEVEDIKRIESMLTCMLRETIIESYLQNQGYSYPYCRNFKRFEYQTPFFL